MKINVIPFTLGFAVLVLSGCASTGLQGTRIDGSRMKEMAFEGLRRGASYEGLPTVRAQAIESLQYVAPERGLSWIRLGLDDSHHGVRFAACMALGSVRDAGSREKLTALLGDPDRNVQAAAIFALHRLGDTRQTHRLADFLNDSGDGTLRGNTALILGRLGEPGAKKLLKQLLRDEKDEGIRLQVLESLALLGDEDAAQQLTILALSEGDKGAFVLGSLGELQNQKYVQLFRNVMTTAQHLESKLIAARSLGRLEQADGYALALDSLDFNEPQASRQDDPDWNQVIRARQLAALALGAIGNRSALPALNQVMTDRTQDPRVQLAAARAILEILN